MCGVFGIYDHPEAANLAYLGLHALQHRGQESAGVVSNDDGTLHGVRQMGQVRKIFTRDVLARLTGTIAIGHVRYTTAGGSISQNIQPLWAQTKDGSIAIAHNGNLVNERQLRALLESEGSIFTSMSDTEVILQLMARSRAAGFVAQLRDAMSQVQGERVRDIEPGEILVIDDNGLTSVPMPPAPRRFCVFEHVYFARPDSVLDGVSVYESRIRMGEQLAKEHPVQADAVIPVPDSGVVAAMGFARQSGIPFEMGLIRNHYVGRTFIEPMDSIRHFGVRLKLNAVPHLLEGKRVAVVDASIVRGTTSRKIVRLIRNAGAKEVHVRISSPPVDGPCHYGIDTPTRAELVASSQTVEEIGRIIEADSLGYLSADGLRAAVLATEERSYCDACFTGDYPITIRVPDAPRQLRLIEV